MILLAIDCAANLCAACVFDTAANVERGRVVLDLGKGHAEHLIGVVAKAMRLADMRNADLDGIAVSIGPGSFTGIRVAVSAARGLALTLGIPVAGIDTLEAIAEETRGVFGDVKVLSALASGPDNIQLAVYDELGRQMYAPAVMSFEDAADMARTIGAIVAGTGAARLAAAMPEGAVRLGPQGATADIGAFARVAARKGFDGGRPSPLYLREPDARPQAGFMISRKSPVEESSDTPSPTGRP